MLFVPFWTRSFYFVSNSHIPCEIECTLFNKLLNLVFNDWCWIITFPAIFQNWKYWTSGTNKCEKFLFLELHTKQNGLHLIYLIHGIRPLHGGSQLNNFIFRPFFSIEGPTQISLLSTESSLPLNLILDPSNSKLVSKVHSSSFSRCTTSSSFVSQFLLYLGDDPQHLRMAELTVLLISFNSFWLGQRQTDALVPHFSSSTHS